METTETNPNSSLFRFIQKDIKKNIKTFRLVIRNIK